MYYKPDTLLRLDSVNVASNSGITFMARDYRYSSATGALDRIKLNSESVLLGTNLDLMPSTNTYPSNVGTTHSWTANHGLYDKTFSKVSVDTAFRRAYGYDGQGRMTEYLRRSNNQWAVKQFTYDSLGRLTKRAEVSYSTCAAADTTKGYNCMPDSQAPIATYSYDEVGNRTDAGSSYVLGTGNRLTTWFGVTMTHDLDGNTATRTVGGVTRVFGWSAEGRLRSVAYNGDTLQYDYDPLGRLVRKQRRGTTERHFLWDGDQLLAELNATATNRVSEYAYWPGIDRPLGFATGATAIAQIRYYAQDEVGNVVGVFKDSTRLSHFFYNDWGAITTLAPVNDTTRLHWKGLIWEGDSTKLYYVRNRWYDANIGRFISEDPIGVNGGLNLYLFAGSDPIQGRDPFGLRECSAADGWEDHWDDDDNSPKVPTPTNVPVVTSSTRHDCSDERAEALREAQDLAGTPVTGPPSTWQRVAKNTWRYFGKDGKAVIDKDWHPPHQPKQPTPHYHGWSDGVRQKWIPPVRYLPLRWPDMFFVWPSVRCAMQNLPVDQCGKGPEA
jgi:RHS repeat-associated protein